MSWWRETVTARWCQTNNMISKQMMTQSWALPSLHNSLSAPVLMSMLFSSFTHGLIISWTQMHECFPTVVLHFLLSYIMVSGPNASSEGEASSALRSKGLLSQRLLLAATGSNKKSWTADAFKSYTTIRGAGPRWSSNPDHLPSSWAQPIYPLSFFWNCRTQGQYCGGVSRASTCSASTPTWAPVWVPVVPQIQLPSNASGKTAADGPILVSNTHLGEPKQVPRSDKPRSSHLGEWTSKQKTFLSNSAFQVNKS